MQLGAVLLAAGRGSRLGYRPKCLLELDGEALVRRQLSALTGAGIQTIVVVLGHHAALIKPRLPPFPVSVVHNPDPDAGQVSSQRLGLAALPHKLDAVVVALADQPMLNAQDIADLIRAWEQRREGAAVVYPEVGGARGNPVIFSAAVREQVLAGAPDFGCRQWQSLHPEAVASFVSDNRRYRIDIDTPEDLVRFERETGQALRWPAGTALA